MSRIDDLIDEFAPDGINYVEIQNLFNLKNGYTPSKSNASFWADGTIPWFRMEDIRANGGILDQAIQRIPEVAVKGGKLFPANSMLVATSATIGEHALVTVPHLSNQRFTSLALRAEYADRVDMKFVYYYGFVLDEWCRNNTTTSSFASVDMKGFKEFKFPIPPLNIQREIVRVLDQFVELETELEAELNSRRRQNEHFRRSLLTFSDTDFHWVTLGDAVEFLDHRRKPVTRADREPGEIPYYGANGIQGWVKDHIFEGDFLLMGEDGSVINTDGSPVLNWASGKIWVNNHAHVLAERPDVALLRFLYFYLQTVDVTAITRGTPPKINQASTRAIPIPLPSLEEQLRIVKVLDKFDALVNDVNIGLPAEIVARRKQYEYYRDRLLTFEEVPA